MSRFYVYEIRENGVAVYVGKDCGDRMHMHGNSGHNRGPLLFTAQQNSVASRDRLLLRVARGLLRWTWRYPRLAAISGLITTAEFHRFFT